jgi:hypothetical protein
MQARAGRDLDPLLVKVLVGTLGQYPIGTAVRLTTGETALVTAAPREPRRGGRPRVRVIATDTGRLEPGAEVDLGTCETRAIAEVLAREEVFATSGHLIAAV